LIHRLLDPLRAAEFAIEQGWRIRPAAIDECVGRDPDQAKSSDAVGLAS